MKDWKRINSCLKLLDVSYKQLPNCVRIHNSNDIKHELAKTKICYLLQKQGLVYYTEAIFKGGKGRADVLVPEHFRVIEVLNTETEVEVLQKKNYYPEELDILYFTTDEILNEDFMI